MDDTLKLSLDGLGQFCQRRIRVEGWGVGSGEWCKHVGEGDGTVWCLGEGKHGSLMWLKGRWEWSRTRMRTVGQQGETPQRGRSVLDWRGKEEERISL